MPIHLSFSSFFFNDTATTEIYTLSLHDALPISDPTTLTIAMNGSPSDLDPHSVYDYRSAMPLRGPYEGLIALEDRKSTRLNSSHSQISYAVFCLKKKKKQHNNEYDQHQTDTKTR